MITGYVYFGPKISELGNIPGVTLSKKEWGEIYCSVGNFNSKPHENIIKYADRTEVVCVFTPDQGIREKGIYRSGKITAELDRSVTCKDRDYVLSLKGQGYCVKEMEALYHDVRAGNIKPEPCDNYEKEQCKEDPRLASTIVKQINKIIFKRFLFPLGFWREVRSIMRKAESEMTA